MRDGAIGVAADLPHVQSNVIVTKEQPACPILLDQSPRKVALMQGTKIHIVDLASGPETILPTISAIDGRSISDGNHTGRLLYAWACHAANKMIVGGGLLVTQGNLRAGNTLTLEESTGTWIVFSANTLTLEESTGTWVAGPAMPMALSGARAVSVGGAVYVLGGWSGRDIYNRDLLRYESGAWKRMAQRQSASISWLQC